MRIEKKGNFLFVPLDEQDSKKKDFKPEHVVPISSGTNQIKYVGLSTSEKSYRVVRSIEFLACQETKTVNANREFDTGQASILRIRTASPTAG